MKKYPHHMKSKQKENHRQYVLKHIKKITLTQKALNELTKVALKKTLRKAGICLSRDFLKITDCDASPILVTFSQNKLS